MQLNFNSSKDNPNKNLINRIDDFNKLQNALIQIENFINDMIHNNNNDYSFKQNNVESPKIENQIMENKKQEEIVQH